MHELSLTEVQRDVLVYMLEFVQSLKICHFPFPFACCLLFGSIILASIPEYIGAAPLKRSAARLICSWQSCSSASLMLLICSQTQSNRYSKSENRTQRV